MRVLYKVAMYVIVAKEFVVLNVCMACHSVQKQRSHFVDINEVISWLLLIFSSGGHSL